MLNAETLTPFTYLPCKIVVNRLLPSVKTLEDPSPHSLKKLKRKGLKTVTF